MSNGEKPDLRPFTVKLAPDVVARLEAFETAYEVETKIPNVKHQDALAYLVNVALSAKGFPPECDEDTRR